MAKKRIYPNGPTLGLSVEPTKDLEQWFELDKLGFAETKRMSLDVLLRSDVSVSEDAAGLSTYELDYELKDRISVTIDEDCEFSFTNLPLTGSVNYFRVDKGVNDLVTFAGIGVNVSKQIGLTTLLYRIEKRGGFANIGRINNQFTDSLVIGDLVPATGTITDFQLFESTTNNNVCNFETLFTFEAALAINSIIIAISNWGVTKKFPPKVPAWGYIIVNGIVKPASMLVDETSLIVHLSDLTLDPLDEVLVYVSGSFQIK